MSRSARKKCSATSPTSNRGPLPPDAAKRVFERIIDEMRKVQRERMEK